MLCRSANLHDYGGWTQFRMMSKARRVGIGPAARYVYRIKSIAVVMREVVESSTAKHEQDLFPRHSHRLGHDFILADVDPIIHQGLAPKI